ncbi:hypothetical protein CYMTET_5731 [Cymbomonas tetramitiformis]|uniref:Uncharacterized protein n=1 Tax=Cymbomonas tetramitiformis TaxID=36881 RepID=A0AAE0LIK5_9CHLO|nr:hypothetical protein CYMTET_5731 [Cymbomonas tetramitiformis]
MVRCAAFEVLKFVAVAQHNALPTTAHHRVVPLRLQPSSSAQQRDAEACGHRAAQRTTGSDPQQRRAVGTCSISAMRCAADSNEAQQRGAEACNHGQYDTSPTTAHHNIVRLCRWSSQR